MSNTGRIGVVRSGRGGWLALVAIATAAAGLAAAVPAHAYKYVEKQRSSIPGGGDVTKLVAKCPDGAKVVGGGVTNTGAWTEAKVTATAPVDGRDPRRKRDDAWAGFVQNNSGGTLGMTVYATCVKGKLKRKLAYVKETRGVPANAERAAIAECPDGKVVVGGGVDSAVAATGGTITSTIFDLLAVGKPDYWTAALFNNQASRVRMSVYAVCTSGKLKRGLHAVDGTDGTATTIGGNAQSAHAVDCPAGERVLGGGAFLEGDAVALNATSPTDGPDDDTRPNDGWISWGDNFHPFNNAVIASVALCR